MPLKDDKVLVEMKVLGNETNDMLNEMGYMKESTFDAESDVFQLKYVSGTKAGPVSFSVEAKAKTDESVKLTQVEDITLTEAVLTGN
jgi:hypothetical protein